MQKVLKDLSSRVDILESSVDNLISDHAVMKSRIADLESMLKRVINIARGDGREATTSEFQMTIRTASAILENKLILLVDQ